MRVPLTPDDDEPPPPPYTARDLPSSSPTPGSQEGVEMPIRTSLRGGYMRPSPQSQVSHGSDISSAAAYFENRPYDQGPALERAGLNLNTFEHTIAFVSGMSREDIGFPHPPDIYFNRDILYDDWVTFTNFLFPPPGYPLSEKTDKAEKGKSGRSEERRSFSHEDTPDRCRHIRTVIAEWNEGFFGPRQVRILAQFGPTRSPVRSESSAAPERTSHEEDIHSESDDDLNATREAPSISRPTEPQPRGRYPRSDSISSSPSSRSSSSDFSISSIASKDLEGCSLNGLRNALEAFRADPTKQRHLRNAVNQLRETLRAQSRSVSSAERKDMKKKLKSGVKDTKKEIKGIVKNIQKERRAERLSRCTEQRSRREGKMREPSFHGQHRPHNSHDKHRQGWHQPPSAQAWQEMYGQPNSQQPGASFSHAHGPGGAFYNQSTDWRSFARGRAREAEATARAHAAHVQAQSWQTESAARESAMRTQARAQATAAGAQANANDRPRGEAGRARARAAEQRAQETVREAQSRDYGSHGRQSAREAERRAAEMANHYATQNWGRYGREAARAAEQRAGVVAADAHASSSHWGNISSARAAEAVARAERAPREV